MEKMCVVCHNREMAFRCIQCHKPVCDECAFKDDNGGFCSRECAAKYRAYREASTRLEVARPKGSLAKSLIILLILVGVILFAAWKLGLLSKSARERPLTETVKEKFQEVKKDVTGKR